MGDGMYLYADKDCAQAWKCSGYIIQVIHLGISEINLKGGFTV